MYYQFKTAKGASSVTPDDNNDLPKAAVALYVNTPGNIRVTMLNGDIVTFENAAQGTLGITVRRVHATGTTASVVALYPE